WRTGPINPSVARSKTTTTEIRGNGQANLHLTWSRVGVDRVALQVGQTLSDVRLLPWTDPSPRPLPRNQARLQVYVANWVLRDQGHRLGRGVVLGGFERHRIHGNRVTQPQEAGVFVGRRFHHVILHVRGTD